ncbi:unnamed protein product [Linum trigynum]|uniref:Uncharacterized protein n=1 Tax=Linum trigynum TaxID=586398 RepID=A0AAV2CX30_9ROSI
MEMQISSEQVSDAASTPSETQQPVAMSWNDNGGLADSVQSYPQTLGVDGGEHSNSNPVCHSGRRFVDGGNLMMLDDTLPPPSFTNS